MMDRQSQVHVNANLEEGIGGILQKILKVSYFTVSCKNLVSANSNKHDFMVLQ